MDICTIVHKRSSHVKHHKGRVGKMLTKQQKNFRKEMKEIKEIEKQKDNLYYEIYRSGTPKRQWRDTPRRNYSMWIRVILFLGFFVWTVYKSGVITHLINGQGALDSNHSNTPAIFNTMASSLTIAKEQECSDYLQSTSLINQQLTNALNNYSQEIISYSTAKEEISKLWDDLEQIVVVKHGEDLRETMVESLAKSLHYIDLVESLRTTRIVRTEKEKEIWYLKEESARKLDNERIEIAHKYNEEVKLLLKNYDMGYVENEKGIEYYYRGDVRPGF